METITFCTVNTRRCSLPEYGYYTIEKEVLEYDSEAALYVKESGQQSICSSRTLDSYMPHFMSDFASRLLCEYGSEHCCDATCNKLLGSEHSATFSRGTLRPAAFEATTEMTRDTAFQV